MSQLRNFLYKILSHEESTEVPVDINMHEQDLCFICQDNIDPTLKESVTLLSCKHIFHKLCIDPWTHCPQCDYQENLDSDDSDNSEKMSIQMSRQASSIDFILNSEADNSITTSKMRRLIRELNTPI
ncbi:2854_t:CDS:2, partial [Scutellospora calospora]